MSNWVEKLEKAKRKAEQKQAKKTKGMSSKLFKELCESIKQGASILKEQQNE